MSLTSKKRVTLVEQQSSFGVTDPSSHAKRQAIYNYIIMLSQQ